MAEMKFRTKFESEKHECNLLGNHWTVACIATTNKKYTMLEVDYAMILKGFKVSGVSDEENGKEFGWYHVDDKPETKKEAQEIYKDLIDTHVTYEEVLEVILNQLIMRLSKNKLRHLKRGYRKDIITEYHGKNYKIEYTNYNKKFTIKAY